MPEIVHPSYGVISSNYGTSSYVSSAINTNIKLSVLNTLALGVKPYQVPQHYRVIDGFFPEKILNMKTLRGANTQFQNVIGSDIFGDFYSQHDNAAVVQPVAMHGSNLNTFTVVFIFSLKSTATLTGERRMIGSEYHNYGLYKGHSFRTSGTNVGFSYSYSGSSVRTHILSPTQVIAGKRYVAVATMSNGTATLYLTDSSPVLATGLYTPTTTTEFDLYARNDDLSTTIGSNLRVYGIYYLNGALSSSEAQQLVGNPYLPFRKTFLKHVDLGADSVNEKKPDTPRQSFLLGTAQPGPKPSVAPVILRDWKRHGQPQGPVEVDWGNPLAQGLLFLSTPSTGLGDSVLSTPPSSDSSTVSFYDSGLYRSYTSAQETVLNNTLKPKTYPLTLFADVVLGGGATSQTVISLTNSTQYAAILWRGDSANRLQAAVIATNFRAWTSTNSYATGSNIFVAARFESATVFDLFVNGVKLAGSFTAPNNVTSLATLNIPKIGGNFNGKNLVSGGFARALSDAEIASISANPWQLFKPRKERIFVGV